MWIKRDWIGRTLGKTHDHLVNEGSEVMESSTHILAQICELRAGGIFPPNIREKLPYPWFGAYQKKRRVKWARAKAAKEQTSFFQTLCPGRFHTLTGDVHVQVTFPQDTPDALNSGKCTSGFWGLAEESGLYRDKRQNLGTWVQRCGSKRKGTLQVVPHLKWLTCGFPSPRFLWLENDVPCRAITALPCIWPRCWGSLVVCLRSTVTVSAKEVPPRIPATLGSGSFRLVCNKAMKNLESSRPLLLLLFSIFYIHTQTYTHICIDIYAHMYRYICTYT